MEKFIELLVKLHNNVPVSELPEYVASRNIKQLIQFLYIHDAIPMDVSQKCIKYLKPFDDVIEQPLDPWAITEYQPNRKLAYELLIVVH